MERHRPAPGEELNRGTPTKPRPAASVIVLRGGGDGLEVLLLRRNPEARFMGGAWVFPGGGADAGEDLRSAAVREVAEEAGLVLDSASLIPFSRWITPAQITIRYDAHFFLAPVPDGQEPRIDGAEVVDLGWYEPAAALAAPLHLVFPTIKHLEQLAGFATADELLAWAPDREIVAVEPRVVEGTLVLPGEPGY
jgi:8-oxo-dGTP pyrophosphatase MutT (NUDIX family)